MTKPGGEKADLVETLSGLLADAQARINKVRREIRAAGRALGICVGCGLELKDCRCVPDPEVALQ